MNRPPRSSTANSGQSQKSNDRKRMLLINMGLVLFLIICTWLYLGWMLSDVTGEYYADDTTLGVVRLSLIRRATNIKGELSYGHGAILEMTTNKLDPDQEVNLKFELPQKWVDEGQPYRVVNFIVKISDGTATGVIRDYDKNYKVTLQKNSIASIYRQIQSHLPFAG